MHSGFLQRAANVVGRRITVRLAGGYVLLIGMIILVAVLGLFNIQKIRTSYDEVLDVRIPRLTQLQQIQADLSSMNVSARDALLVTDAAKLEQILGKIESGRTTVGERLAALQKVLEEENTAESKEVAQAVGDSASSILVGLIKFSRYIKADKRDPALTVLQESLQPKLEKLGMQISQYQAKQIESLSSVKVQVVDKETQVRTQALGLTVLAIITAALFAWWVVRSVVSPLKDVTRVAHFMAQGDFSSRLDARHQDEVGRVVVAFNEISEGLSALVTSIRSNADLINATAQSIAGGNERLEGRATEQTEAMVNSLAFIREVQAAIADNVATANQATQMASDMSRIAQQSSVSVNDAVVEMASITQSSQKITDIIAMIDSIAFQTNILALNAAVEAARAGEMGRGFAVVASEVRVLAQRSAGASKDIKTLILESQVQVESGTKKVQSITQVIEQVMQTADALRAMVEQIASGSTAQGHNMAEMVGNIEKLESGNANNLQILGGLRSSTDELGEVARELDLKVAEFKVLDASRLRA